MSMSPLYIGLDVGGTSMKAGVVDETGRPLSAVSLPTDSELGQDHGLRRMCETIRAAATAAGVGMERISAIGVATPGTMDIPAGVILDAVNMKGWRNVPVRRHVQETFALPTAFQNDANAAAYGEFWAGAGRGARSLVLFTLGTGVGGGVIVGGADGGFVVEGEHSHGAEIGHIKIEMTNPRRCGCGRLGCLEAYASATAVALRAREALAEDGSRSSLHAVLRSGNELTSREVFAAADAGDELAGRIVEETALYLAIGAMNLMHVIDPELVVFGGGMIAAGDGFLDRIRVHVRRLAFPVPAERTRIVYAQLGGDAGFIGAAACGRRLVRR